MKSNKKTQQTQNFKKNFEPKEAAKKLTALRKDKKMLGITYSAGLFLSINF